MADGLKLVVTGDIKQAQAAMKQLVSDAEKSGSKAGQALGKGLDKATTAIKNIPKAAVPAEQAVSRLGKTIESLQFAIADRKAELIRTTDITRVAQLNGQIKDLEGELVRLKVAGTEGFDGLGNAVQKTGGAFSGVVSAGQGAFSVLRKIAFIIPGIGIAGLVGGLADLVIGLFKSKEGLDETAVSAAKFATAIKDAEEGVKQFVDSLDFGADIDKLKNELQFGKGAKLDLLNFQVDKTKNDKIIAQANSEITELTDKILAIRRDAQFTLSKKGSQLLDSFFNDLEIPDNLIDDLDKKSQAVIRQIKVDATKIKALEDQRLKATQENQKSELEAKIKAKEDAKKVDDKIFEQTVNQAKRIAAFLDKNTQFAVHFEVDPLDEKDQTFKKAKDFIAKAKSFVEKQTPEFKFKPLLSAEFNIIDFDKFSKQFRKQIEEAAPKTWDESKKAFEENVKRAANSNPLVIKTNAEFEIGRERIKKQADFMKSAFAGFKLFDFPDNPIGPDGNKLFDDITFGALKAGAAINQTLAPAFSNLFSAIKAGDNPLKAFFEGIGQAVEQLIQKLIAAAIEAAILSALIPGAGAGKGFGSIFKGLLGFASGGIVSGPTLGMIGEASSTNRNNPEVVAPLDQLRGILAGIGTDSGPQRLYASVRGNDLLLSSNRTNRTNRRLGAG